MCSARVWNMLGHGASGEISVGGGRGVHSGLTEKNSSPGFNSPFGHMERFCLPRNQRQDILVTMLFRIFWLFLGLFLFCNYVDQS